jgi:formylglycine-generating enzyme required for sulfatase activity
MTRMKNGLKLSLSALSIVRGTCLSALFLLATAATEVAAQSGDFTYTSNGSVITINRYTGSGGAVTIPGTIVALPVTVLAAGAFGSTTVTGVTIPNSVTNIGAGAFGNCTSLTAVYFWGNAPTTGTFIFGAPGSVPVVYRLSGAAGFGTVPAAWQGRPTALWITGYLLTVTGGTGGGSYTNGQQVTITANAPAAGKAFDRWTGDAQYAANAFSSTATVTMPALAIALTATYKDVYTLTVNNGTGGGAYTNGQQVTVAANAPAFGKTFDRWTGSTQYVASDTSASTTVTMPAQAIALTATYRDTVYTLTVTGGSGSGSYTNQQRVTITAAAPAPGKTFYLWTDGTPYVASITSSTTTVTMPAQALTLAALYQAVFKDTSSQAFFRIVASVATEITALGTDGTMAWTSETTEGVPCVVQRATSLTEPNNWVDYVQSEVKMGVSVTERLFDPAAPAAMALIPAGSFQMGDNLNEGYAYEQPVRTIYISAFYMDKTEVTWAKWREVRSWATTNGYDLASTGAGKADSHPVQYVNWYECVKWCNARSQKEGLTPCYTYSGSVYKSGQYDAIVCNWSANGYRLPSEAEFEKAARGGLSGKRYPWGDDTIDYSRANYSGHPVYTTGGQPYDAPVGTFAPNGYGLYNVCDNATEWCWDLIADYNPASVSDPHGPDTPALNGGVPDVRRTARSNSSAWGSSYCRAAYRNMSTPGNRYSVTGFREARTSSP